MNERKKSILLVVSHLPGGTRRHVREMSEAWASQGYCVIVLEIYYKLAKLYILLEDNKITDRIISIPRDKDFLLDLLKLVNVGIVHYHHFLRMDDFFINLWKLLEVPFCVTLHDYFTICPLVNLLNYNNCYCGMPSVCECNKCLSIQKNKIYTTIKQEVFDIKGWRNKWYTFLLMAKKVFVPHDDVKQRYLRIFPKLETTVFYNPEVIPVNLKHTWNNKVSDIKVGLIGNLELHKGGGMVLEIVKEIRRRKLPIKLILFGDLSVKSKDYFSDVLIIKGKYTEDNIYQKIEENSIDYFLFPAIWPETYSYTLSIPVRLGIPVLGSDIGAIGARINQNKWGETYPYDSNSSYICNRMVMFNYKKYSMKNNFYIENYCFPSLISFYDCSIEGVISLDFNTLLEYTKKIPMRIEYISLENVLPSDIKLIYKWGACINVFCQVIKKINYKYSIIQMWSKI